MSGARFAVSSPALRRAVLCLQAVDRALNRQWVGRRTRKTLVECRETIVMLERENRQLRASIAVGESIS